MIIGITGSFGTGKTTVACMFSRYGFKVINADRLYHGIYIKNKLLKNKIKKEFGTLDRNKIKRIVFNDYKKLKKLNKIKNTIIIKKHNEKIPIIKRFDKKFNSAIKNNKKPIIGKNNVGTMNVGIKDDVKIV